MPHQRLTKWNSVKSLPRLSLGTAVFIGSILSSSYGLANTQSESKNASPEIEIRQEMTAEFRQFTMPSNYVDHNQDGSLSWQGRYSASWLDAKGRLKNNITLVPFIRYNSQDPERSRFDLQSLSWTHINNNWELRSGIRVVSWRTTESIHLVDIINQTDLTGDVDGEDKLGQSMINLVWSGEWANVELFALPVFRERIFPGKDARLRSSLAFTPDNVIYESGAEELRTDAAIRTTLLLGNWEVAISHFSGTSREPLFLIDSFSVNNAADQNTLTPYYPVIEQSGLEVQYAAGDWLWKFEGISRAGFDLPNSLQARAAQNDFSRYESAAAGFEFTWSGLGETGYDLGILAEYLWDQRRDDIFANDLFIGVRLGLNDIQSTELLCGSIADLNHEEYLSFIEFSRRTSDSGRLDLTARLFDAAGDALSRANDSDFFELHDDDYISLSYTHYF